MITADDITTALSGLGVQDGDTLFVHAGISRCLRVAGGTRQQKLATIVAGLRRAVRNGTLMMPAFSYSFCAGETFDLAKTPSRVGVLSDYFRMAPAVRRTADPIFSVSVLGALPEIWESRLFTIGDVDCFGEQSVFAYLLESDVKLLFFGVAATACTFIHHVEQRERVPYRYFKDFSGMVRNGSKSAPATARFYVRDLDADVETFLVPLVDSVRAAGELRSTRFERGPELTVSSARAYARAAVAGLRQQESFLLERGHPELAHLRYG